MDVIQTILSQVTSPTHQVAAVQKSEMAPENIIGKEQESGFFTIIQWILGYANFPLRKRIFSFSYFFAVAPI